jgi:hypothetical protein
MIKALLNNSFLFNIGDKCLASTRHFHYCFSFGKILIIKQKEMFNNCHEFLFEMKFKNTHGGPQMLFPIWIARSHPRTLCKCLWYDIEGNSLWPFGCPSIMNWKDSPCSHQTYFFDMEYRLKLVWFNFHSLTKKYSCFESCTHTRNNQGMEIQIKYVDIVAI